MLPGWLKKLPERKYRPVAEDANTSKVQKGLSLEAKTCYKKPKVK
jgi:hypothetical protein